MPDLAIWGCALGKPAAEVSIFLMCPERILT